jgi:hypothetical protein
VRWPRNPLTPLRFSDVEDFVEVQLLRVWFGLRHAPAYFSTMSAEIVSTLQRRSREYAADGSVFFFCFVDDIAVFAATEELASRAYRDVFTYLESIGARANAKAVPPTQLLPLLGLLVDFRDPRFVTLSLPGDKAYSCAQAVAVALESARAGVALPFFFCDKLVGKLGHACEVVDGGQLRLIALRDARRADGDGHSGVDLRACVDDLEWWATQLTAPAPSRLRLSRRLASAAHVVNIQSDASGDIGAAIVVGNSAAWWYRWDAETAAPSRSIQAKEIFPLVHVLEAHGRLLRGLTVAYATDNSANAYAINSGSIKDLEARPLLRRVLVAAATCGFRVRAAWNPRENNVLMDAVSKAASSAAALRCLPPGFAAARA